VLKVLKQPEWFIRGCNLANTGLKIDHGWMTVGKERIQFAVPNILYNSVDDTVITYCTFQ
jgi:hypothetical protein